MLKSLKELLQTAQSRGYAVGHFNFGNLEGLQAIIKASESANMPVILAVSEGAIKHAGLDYIMAMVELAAANSKTDFALHLDHGKSFEICEECINAGFSSVMIDASDKSYEENISLTRQVTELAHGKNVSVEAELGRIPGTEEEISSREAYFTDPSLAEEFVKETGIDALAVSIGTAHGAYKGEPKIDFERLSQIREKVSIPLVLHGASQVSQSLVEEANKLGANLAGANGVPEEDIKKAISLGICKVNCDTDLNLAGIVALRKILSEIPEEFKLYKILDRVYAEIEKTIEEKIKLYRNV